MNENISRFFFVGKTGGIKWKVNLFSDECREGNIQTFEEKKVNKLFEENFCLFRSVGKRDKNVNERTRLLLLASEEFLYFNVWIEVINTHTSKRKSSHKSISITIKRAQEKERKRVIVSLLLSFSEKNIWCFLITIFQSDRLSLSFEIWSEICQPIRWSSSNSNK